MLDVRQVNLVFYSSVLFGIGVPLWWITTSPYRAALQPLDPSVVDVEVPFHLRVFYESHLIDSVELHRIVDGLMKRCPDARIHAEFVDVEFHTTNTEADNLAAFNYAPGETDVNVVLLERDQFARHFPRSAHAFRSTIFHPKPTTRALAVTLNADRSRRAHDLSALLERVLGLERLKAVADEEVQKILSVWDRLPIATLYHLHLVFLHSNGRRNAAVEAEIVKQAKRVATFVHDSSGILIDVSAAHLWDFDVDQFIEESRTSTNGTNSTLTFHVPYENAEAITTEVDKFVTWLGVGIAQPLIKLAIFVDEKEVELRDEKENAANAVAVASWGGITTMSVDDPAAARRVSHAILDITKAQLNVRPVESEWLVDFDGRAPTHEFEWLRLRTQAFREHVDRATAALRSIHALRRKIEDLVVSREVAVDVYEAHEVLMATLLKARRHGLIDIDAAIRARILGERAVKHSSTLQLLNFPLEQRYAIYVPLFLPVFVHVVSSIRPLIPVLRASMFGTKLE